MKWSCLPEICQSCIYSHHRAAQITVIKLQLAEGELSATVLMVCVGNDIWWSEEGGISQVILYYHHTSDTLSLLTIVLLAWGHTLTTGSDYTSVGR